MPLHRGMKLTLDNSFAERILSVEYLFAIIFCFYKKLSWIFRILNNFFKRFESSLLSIGYPFFYVCFLCTILFCVFVRNEAALASSYFFL